MKEDYLWNKTGSDAEIKRLENALTAFRYQEIAPPELPAKIIPFERKRPRGFFRLALAFGSLATIAVVCLSVWLQFSGKTGEIAKDSPKIVAPKINENPAREILSAKPTNSAIEKTEKTETPERFAEQKIVKIRKIVPPINRQTKLTARNVKIEKQNDLLARDNKVKNPAIKFTKEETYAYNQLMLALSITGSKLKLVKDKIDGIEEKTGGFENGR